MMKYMANKDTSYIKEAWLEKHLSDRRPLVLNSNNFAPIDDDPDITDQVKIINFSDIW